MKQKKTLSFICFLLVIFLAPNKSLAQDFPKLVEGRFISPYMPPFIPQMKITYELSGASKEDYEEYVEKHEDLTEEFESKRSSLESQYRSASGESKINKAKELIELVLTYMALFDSLEMSGLGQFSGDYKISINANQGMLSINGQSEGTGEVFLSDSIINQPVVVGRKISGSVNGQGEYSAKMAGFMDIEGSGSFSDSLSGYYFDDIISVKHKSFQTQGIANITGGLPQLMIIDGEFTTVNNETSGNFLLAMPGVLLIGDLSPTQASGRAYFFDDELNFYLVASTSNPVEDEEMFFYYTLKLIKPELEEPNFQELIDKYFGYYVNAINNERNREYSGSSDLDQRTNIAKRTLDDLLGAMALGDEVGVSPGVEIGLKLVLRQKDSLFDNWYNLYFTAEDGSIVQKIGGGTDESLHHQRVENFLNGIGNAQMVASSELIQTLGLYAKSDILSTVINNYFNAVHPQKCALGATDYSQWNSEVALLAQIYAQSYVLTNISNANC